MESLGTDPEFQTWLKGLLNDPKCKNLRVVFTKADGTEREMRCTVSGELIPPEHIPKATDRSFSETAMRVFDLDLNAWRSFRWDSIKNVSFEI